MRRLALALLLLAPAAHAQPARPQPARPQPAPADPVLPRPGGTKTDALALDRAFAVLRDAPDAATAAVAEARIRALWARAATPAVALLLARGARELAAHAPADALEDLDAAIALAPELADAHVLRAGAAAATNATAAARDLQEALRLEPRRFDALAALAALQEARGDLAGALRSLTAALALHPHLAGAADHARDLRRRAEGDPT